MAFFRSYAQVLDGTNPEFPMGIEYDRRTIYKTQHLRSSNNHLQKASLQSLQSCVKNLCAFVEENVTTKISVPSVSNIVL